MIDFSQTKAEIQSEMLGQVDNSLDKREGSLIQTAIAPGAWWLEGFLMKLAYWQNNGNSETATGEALDWIVELRGITRKAATAAVRQGTFDAEIPTGSTFKTINGANSVIFESGDLISQTGNTYVYQLTCQQTGIIGNEYTGAILPITAIAGLTTATIGTIITQGTDEETDDSLRERYNETFGAPAYGGNISEYRQAILAIAGVGAVQVYPAYNGGGTVLCSILNDDMEPASSALISTVQNEICPLVDSNPSPNGYGVAPIGAAVTITTGSALTLNMSFDVTFEGTIQNGLELYRTDIENAIENYLASVRDSWDTASVGQTITYPVAVYAARVIYAILTVEAVVNVTNLLINGVSGDLTLTETSALQQVPMLGTVIINGE